MSLIYVGMGVFLIFVPAAERVLDQNYLLPVGVCLMVYGLFRMIRAIQLTKRNL
jgi:hypothetical protein